MQGDMMTRRRPRVLLLIDVYGWAFHSLAKGIAAQLSNRFDFTVVPAIERRRVDCTDTDIIHVFGVRSTYNELENTSGCKILKSLFNTAYKKSHESILEFHERHTKDAHALTVPTPAAAKEMNGLPIPVFLTPEGVDTNVFCSKPKSRNQLIVAWAGNPSKTIKRFWMAHEATRNFCEFRVADGTRDEEAMIDFYNEADVILCTSEYGEGCPRPLLEAMACGCYAVSFRVGVAPEIIVDKRTGLIVDIESVNALRDALTECSENLHSIRENRGYRSAFIGSVRDWKAVAQATAAAYESLL